MLIDFSIENFRSFGAEQTLNLVASNKLQEHPEHCTAVANTGKSALRTAVIYGANAAGKSNLVRAMLFAQAFIRGTLSFQQLALDHFRFGKKKNPSAFVCRYLVDDWIFSYGFAVTPQAVIEEWLDVASGKNREVNVYHRKEQTISVGKLKAFGSEGEASVRALKALQFLGVRPEQLLLNKIVDLPESHRGKLLDKAVWWFTDCLTVLLTDSSFPTLIEFLNQDTSFRRFAAAFLQNVGTGIVDLRVEQTEIEAERVPQEFLKRLQSSKGREAQISIGGSGVQFHLDPNDPTNILRENLAARHRVSASDFSLPFQDESDGTQRCLNLLPALYHLTKQPGVFVIDEINRSLHPLLCYALMKLFLESCPGGPQQMIVTTHETHLLDLDLLRRDEIWFAEKDDKQQTQLYSLADMKVRNDVRIEKGYLQGRFGGIPFLGDTKKLTELIHCAGNGKDHAKKTAS